MTPAEVKQLVERLTEIADDSRSVAPRSLVLQAASALTLLAQEREELREALKPFAREADAWESLPDIATLAMTNPEGDASPFDIRVGELRRARSLLPRSAIRPPEVPA